MKLKEAYYQSNHFCVDGKAVRELHKITFIPKRDVKSRLGKQEHDQVYTNLLRK